MKQILAIFLCALLAMVTACSSPPLETNQSSKVSEEVEAPKINEYGIDLSLDEFQSRFNNAADGKYVMSDISVPVENNASSTISCLDGTEINCSVFFEDGKLLEIRFNKECSEGDEETYVEATSEVFKTAWAVLYPDKDADSLDEKSKELRYSGERTLFNDLYVSFGNTDSFTTGNRWITWTIQSIKLNEDLWG